MNATQRLSRTASSGPNPEPFARVLKIIYGGSLAQIRALKKYPHGTETSASSERNVQEISTTPRPPVIFHVHTHTPSEE